MKLRTFLKTAGMFALLPMAGCKPVVPQVVAWPKPATMPKDIWYVASNDLCAVTAWFHCSFEDFLENRKNVRGSFNFWKRYVINRGDNVSLFTSKPENIWYVPNGSFVACYTYNVDNRT